MGLKENIIHSGGPRRKKQEDACEKVLSHLNNAIKELNSAKVIVTSSDKAVHKASKARKAAEKDLQKSKTLLEKKEQESDVLKGKALKLMELFEKVKIEETERRKEIETVSKECEDLKKTQTQMESNEIEMVAKGESYIKVITDCNKRINHWEGELLKLRDAEDDDDDYDNSRHDIDDENRERVNSGEKIIDDKPIDNNEYRRLSSKTGGKCSSLPLLSESSLLQYNHGELRNDISVLENQREKLAKNANMSAIAEYKKKDLDYMARIAELDEVTEARNEARNSYEQLRRLRYEKFMTGFNQITLKLKEMYQMITLGGDAELELVDSLDPFSEGIVFSVRPPKKSWKNIANLSGGEKTLSSLALVFALHHFKPTPLYVMDEIDAALDFKNVSIVANYIKQRTKNAQFIIVSLRSNMFEIADRLIGIYKTYNCSKSVGIDPDKVEVVQQPSTSKDKVEIVPKPSASKDKFEAVQQPSTSKQSETSA